MTRAITYNLILLLMILRMHPRLIARGVLIKGLKSKRRSATSITIHSKLRIVRHRPILLTRTRSMHTFPILKSRTHHVSRLMNSIMSGIFNRRKVCHLRHTPAIIQRRILRILRRRHLQLLHLSSSHRIRRRYTLNLILRTNKATRTLFLKGTNSKRQLTQRSHRRRIGIKGIVLIGLNSVTNRKVLIVPIHLVNLRTMLIPLKQVRRIHNVTRHLRRSRTGTTSTNRRVHCPSLARAIPPVPRGPEVTRRENTTQRPTGSSTT